MPAQERAALETSSQVVEERTPRVLQLVAKGASLAEVLNALTLGIERLAPDCLCSILLLDEERKHLLRGSGGSLPEEYMNLVNGLAIGPDVGSCGSAAYRNETVVVEDISTDYRWAAAKALPLGFGLKACWSVPIRDSRGAAVGTFAMYHLAPASPRHGDLRLVEAAALLAGNAIERLRSEQRLRENAERLELAEQAAQFWIWDLDIPTEMLTLSSGFAALIGSTEPVPRMRLEQFRELVHPADRHFLQERQWRAQVPALTSNSGWLHGTGNPVGFARRDGLKCPAASRCARSGATIRYQRSERNAGVFWSRRYSPPKRLPAPRASFWPT